MTAIRKAIGIPLLLLVLFAGACTRPGQQTAATAAKVVVIGLDGATWNLLDPFMKRGLLPNLKRLRDGGSSGPLQSIQPSSSPVIWTTIATGKTPQQHGITYFVRFPKGPGEPAPVTSNLRRVKAIWNLLSEQQRDVAIVGWFVTWPVEAVNGRMISDRAHWGALKQRTFPPGYMEMVEIPSQQDAIAAMPRFMNFTYDPASVRRDASDPREQENFLVFDRFVRAYLRDLYYLRAAEYVLDDGRLPDFLAVYMRGTDDVQHGFWKYMDPAPFGGVRKDAIENFGHVIERYWQWTDEIVGRILAHYDANTLVLILSDHGAGPAVGRYRIVTKKYLHLSGSHRDKGILIAHGPGIRKGARIDGASVYDITPTILHYMGMAVAKDMKGKVLTDLFDDRLRAMPVQTIATYEKAGKQPEREQSEPVPSKVDDRVLEHLRSLGYID